jgi:hypothetical protein
MSSESARKDRIGCRSVLSIASPLWRRCQTCPDMTDNTGPAAQIRSDADKLVIVTKPIGGHE